MDFDRLSFVEVSKNFGRRRALTRISFECRTGEIVGLLGPNGAGKSTLLSIAATMLRPSSGDVRYGTRTAAEHGSLIRGRIGLLAHELQLYPELTARENLEFFAGLHGLPAPRARALAALERTGLLARADDPVGGLSRGMRQRIALERALLHEPTLVLLDEPFTGLDLASTRALSERLRGLAAAGAIVVAATHDLEIAQGLVDRALFLEEGRVAMIESAPAPLVERYRAMLSRS